MKKSKNSQAVLQKLEVLKKKIREEMQIKEDANDINKYRIHFEVAQPSNLIGGTLQQHQV